VSVTIIKDLGKAVLEQDEHRKALRETATGQEAEQEAEPEIEQKTEQGTQTGSKAGEAGDHQPPAAEAGPDHRDSGDSSDLSSGSSTKAAPDDT
jgi:hypothetical protein